MVATEAGAEAQPWRRASSVTAAKIGGTLNAAQIQTRRPDFYRYFFAQPLVDVPADAGHVRGGADAPLGREAVRAPAARNRRNADRRHGSSSHRIRSA